MSSLIFKPAKSKSEVIKLKDLKTPVVGVYKSREVIPKYGTIVHVIISEDGTVTKIMGCHSLDKYLVEEALGKIVMVALKEMKISSGGHKMAIADVQFGEHSDNPDEIRAAIQEQTVRTNAPITYGIDFPKHSVEVEQPVYNPLARFGVKRGS